MPRPIKLRSRESGEVYTMQWDKARDPTSREINRFLDEQERPDPSLKLDVMGPLAPEKKRSFNEQTQTFPSREFKLEDVGAFNQQQGRNASEAMPIPQNQNAGVQQEAGMFRKVVDTLYGGEQSALPPIRGITRPALPELSPEFKASMQGVPGSSF